MKYQPWKRMLCCLLTAVLIFGNIPIFSFAEESDGLCPHHTVHTPECGYTPASPGSPCTHEHTDDCYQTVTECVHTHDDTCGYVPAVEGQDCDCVPDAEGVLTHAEGCGYVEAVEGTPCGHTCSAESGCVTRELVCPHIHDAACGYIAPTPEQPCTYVCQDCAEPQADEAVEAVRALMEALPSLEEVKAMTMAEQSEVYNQVQKAYDAYDALTDDQKAQLPEAEGIFAPLFEHFNSLTAPSANVLHSGTCGSSLTWALTDDGVLTISGSGKMNDYDDKDAPWEDYSDDITTVKIDSGVETIGYCAFAQCPNLTGFEIAADSAYFSCVDGVLFNADKTKLINYPRGLTQEKYTIPDTVTEIDGYAFIGPSLSRNRNLKTLEIPASVVYFGEHALERLGSAVTSVPGAIRYADSFAFHMTSIQEVTIAEGATRIYEYAFANTSLKKVTIPSTMKYVYNGVFFATNLQDIYYSGTCSQWNAISISLYDNSVLKTAAFHPAGSNHVKVSIPAVAPTCTATGLTAGEKCSVCGEILTAQEEIPATGHTEQIIPGKAATCTGGLTNGKKCSVCGEILVEQQTIPAVHTFEDGVCSKCGAITGNCGASGDNLTYILTQDGVLTITGTGAMDDYPSLNAPWYAYLSSIQKIVLDSGLTYIGERAFQYCSNLTDVTIPESVTGIGSFAFACCHSLTGITLPSGLTTLGSNPFGYCNLLTSITIPETNASFCSVDGVLFNKACTEILSVPSGKSGSYSIPESVTGIGSNAFTGCKNLTDVTIPEGVTSIANAAFDYCSGLTGITIPESVTNIATAAFEGCSGLTDITIPSSVTSIDRYAFKDCSSLTSITFSGDAPTFSFSVFSNVTATVYYPNGNSTWENVAGKSYGGTLTWETYGPASEVASGTCGENLTWVLTSDGVLTINGTGDMYNYSSVSSTPWYSHASSITSLVVTEGVTSIGSYALRATGLKSVSFGSSSLSLGNYSFANCASLTSIDFGTGTIQPGEYVFMGCTALTSVHVPQNVVMDGSYSGIGSGLGMFSSCSNLQTATVDCDYVGPFFFESCYDMTQVTFTNPNVQFYFLKDNSGHPFNAGSKAMNVEVVGCLCSQANVLVQKGQRSDITLTFSQIAGDTTQHTEQVLPGTATCTEAGLSEGKVCSVCGYVIGQQTNVGALGHDLQSHDGQPASCTEDGWADYETCSRCNYTTYKEIPAAHTLSHVEGKAATCTEAGNIAHYHCSACQKNFEDANSTKELTTVSIPASHNLSPVAEKAATCTEAGNIAHYHCSVCQKNFEDANGTKELTTVSIPASHKLSPVAEKAATCTEAGNIAHYHCSVCQKNFEDANSTKELTTVSIPASHKLSPVAEKAATCTEAGNIAHYHCSACQKNFEDANGTKELSDISIPIAEHEWGEWAVTTPATPEADGVETRKCAVCQQEETRPLVYSGNRLLLTGTELENQSTVWIDGAPVSVQTDDAGNSYVVLPEGASSILVTYSFKTGSDDRHTQYPTGMNVYRVETTDSGLTVKHLPELQNLLQYSGCSIRITGNKGIRMITSINKSTRSALMGDGLAGYTLVEYGTALCRAGTSGGSVSLVLGGAGVKSNHAYKRGVADPIFKDTGSLIQYTNVLVGFTDEDCKEDIAMRPYIILQDEKGETVTIYGGVVYRSIGYIAWQNRNAFTPGSAAYEYVWNIIRYVYGDQYDADYKG